MNKALIITLALGLGLLTACDKSRQATTPTAQAKSATVAWMDDFEKAKAEAAALKRPILAYFTGSDWCGWCVKLKSEALDTEPFAAFAKDNLVLFEADFPRGKELSEKVKAQNEDLAGWYRVNGFPTLFLLSAEGKILAETGYQEGGAEAYVAHLKELISQANSK